MDSIRGYKTKIGLVLYIILGGLIYVGLIENSLATLLGTLITAWTGYGIYDKLERSN